MPLAVHSALLAVLPEVLASAPALLEPLEAGRVLSLARTLPAVFDRMGFEARLAEAEPQLDLGICVEREQAAELAPVVSGVCSTFVSRWLEPAGVLGRAVPQAWFELDVGASAAVQSGSAWSAAFPFARIQDGACRPDTIDALCEVASTLTDRVTSESVRPLFASLPRDAHVLHTAALEHRGMLELRVEFAADTRGLIAWMDAYGAGASHHPVLRFLLEQLPIRQVAVQLSWRGGELRPHSVEVDWGHHASQNELWLALFDALLEAGLASERKLHALRAWPGSSMLRLAGEPALVRLTRSFHVTLKLGAQLEAKAYPYLAAAYALC